MGGWAGWLTILFLFLISCGGKPTSIETGAPGGADPGCQANCPPPAGPAEPPRPTNPVPAENEKAGDPSWRSGRTAQSGELDVYLSTDSAAAGENVSVMISADPSVSVTVDVFRLGYYGGAGARKVWSGGPFNVARQANCPRDPITSLVECRWSETFSFNIGADWVSGMYLLRVVRPDGSKRFAPLVVRDRRAAEVLFKAAINTYQAYNAWGGESLYVDASGTMPSGRAFQVSYDRPYRDGDGAYQLLLWEYPLLRLLEKYGYDVTYATSVDFSRFSDLLRGIGVLVISGHDEYWTATERAQADEAVASGQTSLAHFGANGSYWRVRYENDSAGTPFRTITCYKGDTRRDPIPYSTIRFREGPNPLPENQLFGNMYDSWQQLTFPLIVGDPSHWLFSGTGVSAGEPLHWLLGVEFDRVYPEFDTPPDTRIIMESPVITNQNTASVSHVVERTLPAGNTVFSAGTFYWSSALAPDRPETDDRVARMTLNVLERALAHRRPPLELPPPGPARPGSPSIQPSWAPMVEAFAGSPGSAGWRDGPGSSALFSRPTGMASTAAGQVIVADTGNNRIRLIENDPQHTVRTIAGNGTFGFRDGPGADAMFYNPNSLAMGPDGATYVADSENHVIRRIENNPPTWTVSTYAGVPQQAGFANGPPNAARFNRPAALAFDSQGNLYVAEVSGHRIRMIRAGTREVSTYAGTGISESRDSDVGTNASFAAPSAISVASTGEMYILDAYSQYVRRISPSGNHPVDTIAGAIGQAVGHVDGPGSVARFRAQMGMALGSSGEILLADSANFRIRKVVPGSSAASTQVYTIAGNGRRTMALGPGQAAGIVAPSGLVIATNGRLLVSDSFDHVVRSIVR